MENITAEFLSFLKFLERTKNTQTHKRLTNSCTMLEIFYSMIVSTTRTHKHGVGPFQGIDWLLLVVHIKF